jgi:hypothetical protein
MLMIPHSTLFGMSGATDRFSMLIQRWGWGLRGKGFMVGGTHITLCMTFWAVHVVGVLRCFYWLNPAVQAQCRFNPISGIA